MDPRQILTAALNGRYDLLREIGEGGMATVYLARDVRHDREVALKVLKPELGAVLGVERFLSEIKTTAKLQHPHILPLLDSGNADGLLFYVMPYVQGESLRARLERERQLPIPEAVRIACEIASALDYAHRHGVIHRDIKPENILLHDGQALVADFGIALAVQSAGGQRMTQTGLSLGTPQYMSPEQAMGEKTVDARSDIYALGAVTYEMLVGDAPFTGSSVQAIVARVLNERPTPLRTLRDTVPSGVENAVLTALAKLAADRFSSAQKFAEALVEAGAPVTASAAQTRTRLRDPVFIGLVVALVAALGVIALKQGDRGVADSEVVVRVPIELPRYVSAGSAIGPGVSISDDGRTIAYIGGLADAAPQQVLVRRVDESEPRAVAGSEGAQSVFLSRDGSEVLFWVKGRIAVAPLSGGPPRILSETIGFEGASWLSDGRVVVSLQTGLHIITVAGGAPTPIPGAGADTTTLSSPVAFDGSTTILALAGRARATSSLPIVAVDLATGKRSPVDVRARSIVGVIDGHLLYTTPANQLMAVGFDPRGMRANGSAVQVGIVASVGPTTQPPVAISPSGTLVYVGGSTLAQIVKVDARGRPSALAMEPREFQAPRLSPDGRRLAVAVAGQSQLDVWVFDFGAATFSRLTDDGGSRPEWTPDGARVIYRRGAPAAPNSIMWRPVDQSAPATPVFLDGTSYGYWEAVMTPDGKGLVVQRDRVDRGMGTDVIYRALGDSVERDVAVTAALDQQARPSPDGRWIAFQSALEGSASQVVVKPLDGKGAPVVVSPGAGTEPVWARDRKHLYYRDGQQFIEVEYAAGAEFRIVSRTPIFADVYMSAALPHANYDVLPDGSGFLAIRQIGGRRIVIAHNWRAELRRQLAAQGAR
jgi:Tol biopolymer transport system component